MGSSTFILDNDGNEIDVYSLRYSEFIAINTAKIKQLEQIIADLQAELNKLKVQVN